MILQKTNPDFLNGMPFTIQINNIRHSDVHYHPNAIELLYCLRGNASVKIDNESYIITKGEFVLIEQQNIHCIFSDNDNLFLSMHIDLKKTPYQYETIRYFYFACMTRYCYKWQQNALQEICGTLISAAYLQLTGPPLTHEQCFEISDKLVTLLVDYFGWFTVSGLTPDENQKYVNRLNNTLTYIQKNYNKKITLRQLAKNEFINENYFSQFLKRTPYQSFTGLLNYIRCFEAQKILLTTNATLDEISHHCGFSSKKYFHKYFKSIWNTTPLKFKNWFREYSKKAEDIRTPNKEELLSFMESFIISSYISQFNNNARPQRNPKPLADDKMQRFEQDIQLKEHELK